MLNISVNAAFRLRWNGPNPEPPGIPGKGMFGGTVDGGNGVNGGGTLGGVEGGVGYAGGKKVGGLYGGNENLGSPGLGGDGVVTGDGGDEGK